MWVLGCNCPPPPTENVRKEKVERREGEAGSGGPRRTARRRARAPGGQTMRPSESSLGGKASAAEAPIIIIEGNGAEAPRSSALFYIIRPRPRRTRTGARLLPRRVHAPRGLLGPAPPAWLGRAPRGAALKLRCAPPAALTCRTHWAGLAQPFWAPRRRPLSLVASPATLTGARVKPAGRPFWCGRIP